MSFCLFPIISPPLFLSRSLSLFLLVFLSLPLSFTFLFLPPSSLHSGLCLSCFPLSHSVSIKPFKLSCLHLQSPSRSVSFSLFILHCKHGEAVFCCFQYLFCFRRGYDKPIYQVNISLLLKNRLCQVSVVDLMDMMLFDWWFILCRAEEYAGCVCKALNFLCCDSIYWSESDKNKVLWKQ